MKLLVEVQLPESSEELNIPKTTEEVEEALKAIQEKNNIFIAILLGVTASMIEGIFDPDKLEVSLALAAEAKETLSTTRRGQSIRFSLKQHGPRNANSPEF
ncbi:MAG: hypothetical protein EZS28_025885 [Streblomastix strix]|uniref:Uncharacterized protein n=1 Tax=Streblomastix strix TaxID=222440 RepID=A0A5J4V801_9EUKA|nr:MAG: hypothetical protein EZS28_025885 [Streblomastix strix]